MLQPRDTLFAPYESPMNDGGILSNFSVTRGIQYTKRILSLSVCPTSPFRYAVAAGFQVDIFKSAHVVKPKRLRGFSSSVNCCNFRDDGKLLAVGSESGELSICTTSKKLCHLRKIQAHSSGINALSFLCNQVQVITAGADSRLRLWDVACGMNVLDLVPGNLEQLKSLTVDHHSENVVFCGSVNGCIIQYDLRQTRPSHSFTTNEPISALCLNAADSILGVASLNSALLWDVRFQRFLSVDASSCAGMHAHNLHHKRITGLCIVKHPITCSDDILLSASLDRLLKVVNIADFNELGQVLTPHPLTSIAASPNCELLIVGGERGFTEVRQLMSTMPDIRPSLVTHGKSSLKDDSDLPYASVLHSFSGRWRGGVPVWPARKHECAPQISGYHDPLSESWPSSDSIHHPVHIATIQKPLVMDDCPKKNLGTIDILLTKFDHSHALSRSTRRNRSRHSQTALRFALASGVIRELNRRDALLVAVAGRGGPQLVSLLKFLELHLWQPATFAICIQLLRHILDIYPPEALSIIPEFTNLTTIITLMCANVHAISDIVYILSDDLSRS